MANKARLYEVFYRDGHEEWSEIVAAQSKDAIQAIRPQSDHVKRVEVKSLGWHQVNADLSDDDDVFFKSTVNGKNIEINRGQQGYGYLSQQFAKQAKEIRDFVDEDNEH